MGMVGGLSCLSARSPAVAIVRSCVHARAARARGPSYVSKRELVLPCPVAGEGGVVRENLPLRGRVLTTVVCGTDHLREQARYPDRYPLLGRGPPLVSADICPSLRRLGQVPRPEGRRARPLAPTFSRPHVRIFGGAE
eukprot:6181988-Pleurochrysis_carterae.AAC.2